MGSDWHVATIAEVSEKVAMGPFGSSIKVETFVPDGVPIISGQHLHSFRLDESPGFNFITPEHADRLKNANVQRGDVIFTHAGNIGQVSFIPENSTYERYVISQRQFYMRPDRRHVIPEFVVYYFKTHEGQYKLLANTAQVGVPSIAQPVTYLRTIEIPIPPLDEQRAIAHILGTLDDKIELNRQMNRTLEAIARAVFKSWFVDFEPVRAKAEGRDPGLPKEIADLFPDEFEESEIGEIPKGWHTVLLSEIADIVLGGTPKTSVEEYWNGTIPWASARDISAAAEPFIVQTERTITEAGLNNSNAKLLPAGTTVITSRGTVGRYCILGMDMAINQTNYGLLAKPKVDKYFLYFTVGHLIQELKQRSYGTVFSTITTRTLQGVTVVCPPERVMKVFRHIVSPFMDKVLHHIFEMNTLANIRDSLLPKLISGELRVPNVDRLLDKRISTDRGSRVLYTVGHSNHTIETFIAHLKRHGVTAVADVRSTPYSRFSPQFNRETLAETLKRHGIAYVFLGKELGARPENPSCYDNGCADFKRIAEQLEFKHGLGRILKGMDKYRIALMCAEKEPLECHRTVLVCRNIRRSGVHIKHILYDGSVEDHHDTERRLLKALKMQPSLFEQGMTASDLLERAYDLQARNIAYQPEAKARRHE